MTLWTVLVLGIVSAVLLVRAFQVLPREHWQVLAAIPLRKGENGQWGAANLTWYGFLVATAYGVATAVATFLLGCLGFSGTEILIFLAALLAIAVPAASGIAYWVEGKRATFTVGGAVFVGILSAPLVLGLVSLWAGRPLPFLGSLAALGIAYVFGEGLGRLACLSFGCCYGKPLRDLPPGLSRLFRPIAAVFQGPTKKIAYASSLEGVPVVPIQAITCTVLLSLGVVSGKLFFFGWPMASLMVSVGGSQLWRVFSETLRADHRGGRRFSAYQRMALLGAGLVFLASLFVRASETMAAVPLDGWHVLWSPSTVLGLQALWLLLFLHTGWSRMTSSVLSLHIRRDLT